MISRLASRPRELLRWFGGDPLTRFPANLASPGQAAARSAVQDRRFAPGSFAAPRSATAQAPSGTHKETH
jgi:hypothetical protein